MYPKSLNLRKPRIRPKPQKSGRQKKFSGCHTHPYKPKMAFARKYPVKVSTFSPNPYFQLPRNMSKFWHVENPKIQHAGRKTLFFQKRKFRIPLYSSPNPPFHRPSGRFFPSPRKTWFSEKSIFMQKFVFQWKLINVLYMKILILPKFDQFYEKSYTLKTPLAVAIVQFEFDCATAITGPAITGRNLRLNSSSTLPSFRVYKFQENFRKSVKFHRNWYFLYWFCKIYSGIQ